MSEVKRQTEVYTYAAVLQEGLRHRRKGRVGQGKPGAWRCVN